MSLPLSPSKPDLLHRVSGHHAHAVTGDLYRYQASYLLLGTMVDWTAQIDCDGMTLASERARIGGSIRLSRGQTRSIASTLVVFMVAQAIDAWRTAQSPA